MTKAQIIELQKTVGAFPDGFWGPKSIEACQKHLRALMPSPNPWPKPDQRLREFYGEPGNERALVNLDVKYLGVKYDGTPVKTIRCHSKVADSLLRVLKAIANSDDAYVLEEYAGCFNDRNTRGGNTKSLHAWGAAIDLWPSLNGNWTHWPTRAAMPLSVMEAFAREGWMPAGAFWHRDAMHFHATR